MSGKNSAVNRKAVSSSDEDSGSDSSDSDIFTTTVNLAPLRKAVKETRPKLAEAPLVEEKEKPKQEEKEIPPSSPTGSNRRPGLGTSQLGRSVSFSIDVEKDHTHETTGNSNHGTRQSSPSTQTIGSETNSRSGRVRKVRSKKHLDDETYIRRYKVNQVISQLSLALLQQKPQDHVEFTKQWLFQRLQEEEEEKKRIKKILANSGHMSSSGMRRSTRDGSSSRRSHAEKERDSTEDGTSNVEDEESTTTEASSHGKAVAPAPHHTLHFVPSEVDVPSLTSSHRAREAAEENNRKKDSTSGPLCDSISDSGSRVSDRQESEEQEHSSSTAAPSVTKSLAEEDLQPVGKLFEDMMAAIDNDDGTDDNGGLAEFSPVIVGKEKTAEPASPPPPKESGNGTTPSQRRNVASASYDTTSGLLGGPLSNASFGGGVNASFARVNLKALVQGRGRGRPAHADPYGRTETDDRMSSSGHQSQQSQHTPPSPHSFQGKNPLQSGSDEPNVVPLADVLPAELSGCLKQEEVCSIAKAPSPPPREPSLVGASSSALIHEGRTRLEALLPQIPPSKYASLIVFMEGLVSTQDLLSEAGSAAGPAEALSPGATAADTNAAHLAASPSGSVISASATAAQINEQFSRALSSSTVPHLPESQASESLRAIVRDALSQSVMRSLPQDHGEPSEHNKSPVNRSPNIANMDYPSSPLPVLHAEESSPSVAPPRDDTRTPTGREVTVQYESPTLKEDTTTTVELFSPSPAQTETVADLVQVDSNASVPFPPDKSTTSTIEQSTTTQHAEAASTTSVPTISVSGNIKDLKTIKVGPAAGESRAKKETREGDMPDEVRMDSTIRMAVEQLLAGGEVGVTETAPSSSVKHNNTQEKKSSRLATPENGSIVHSSAVHLAPEGEPQPQPNGEENSTPLPIAETTDGKANPHATSNMVEAMSQFFNAEESRPEEVNTVREALMNYEPFEALDLTQLETLLRTMKRQEYQEGEVLVREGDPSLNKLMFIVSGKLSSARKGKHTKMLNQGSFYGVMEVSYNFDKSRQTLTVKEPGTVIYCLTKTDYQKLILYEKDARRFLFLQYVNKVPFLRQLSPAGKFRLADGLRVSRVREGSYLTRIGANVEWFYIIMSGDVAMTAKKINDGSGSANLTNSGKENEGNGSFSDSNHEITLTRSKGEVVGECELIFRCRGLFDAVATSMVQVARINRLHVEVVTSRQTLEEMKFFIAISPAYNFIQSIVPENYQQELRQVVLRHALRQRRGERKGRSSKGSAAAGTKGSSSHKRLTRCNTLNSTAVGTIVTASGGNEGSSKRKSRSSKRSSRHHTYKTTSTHRSGRGIISPDGEIIFSGSRNLYRFPIYSLLVSGTIIISVVVDGTIIRWNPIAQSVTGYAPYQVVGQSLFDLMADHEQRATLQSIFKVATTYAGKWDQYMQEGLARQYVLSFHQSTNLCQVGLALSVIPCVTQQSSEVLLLVGHEAKYRAASSYAADVSKWLQESLQPQLANFQQRMDILEKNKWEVTPEDAVRLHAHINVCSSMVERFISFSQLNMDSVGESWRPVHLPQVIRQFSIEAMQIAQRSGNSFLCNISEVSPKGEIFLDVQQVTAILRLLLHFSFFAGKNGKPVRAELRVTAVEADEATLLVTSPTQPNENAETQSAYMPDGSPTSESSQAKTAPITSNRTTVNLSPSSLRRIRFEMRDNGETIDRYVRKEKLEAEEKHDSNEHSGSATPNNLSCTDRGEIAAEETASQATQSSPLLPSHVGAELDQIGDIAGAMGGEVYGYTRPQIDYNIVRVELPLLSVPGSDKTPLLDDGDKDLNNNSKTSNIIAGNGNFSVIVADNNPVEQHQVCQMLWARQHAVVPLASFKELMRKLEESKTSADILLLDPLQLDIEPEDYENLQGDDPFDDIRSASMRSVLVVMSSDFSDWRVQKLLDRNAVIELPKVGSGALMHIAMQEAERMAGEMREEESRIERIRRTFLDPADNHHEIVKPIGKGSFGEVYEVRNTLTGGKMAMKRMQIQDGAMADEVVQEILAMTSLHHENIIHYFFCEKESDQVIRLYMELATGGSLKDKIKQHEGVPLPFESIVQHVTDLCRGLSYVHSQHYVHGDLKTANLLLDFKGRIKIGDFGTTKLLKPGMQLYVMTGTPQYMAPEVIAADAESKQGYDFKADIWSVGCMVMEMATGRPPFAHIEETQGLGIMKYLSHLTTTPDLSPLFDINPLVFEFVRSCLDVDPNNRPNAQELLHFGLLQGAVTSTRAERMVKRAEVLYKLNKYAVMREEDADENSQDGSSDDDHNSDYSDYNNEDLLAFIGENEAGWEDTQRDGLYFSSSDGSYEEQTESEGDETDFFNSSTSDREA